MHRWAASYKACTEGFRSAQVQSSSTFLFSAEAEDNIFLKRQLFICNKYIHHPWSVSSLAKQLTKVGAKRRDHLPSSPVQGLKCSLNRASSFSGFNELKKDKCWFEWGPKWARIKMNVNAGLSVDQTLHIGCCSHLSEGQNMQKYSALTILTIC